MTERFGVPVTTPARTVEDLDGQAPPYLVRRATRQAEMAKYRLGPAIRGDRTRSDLERDFLTFQDDRARDLDLRRRGFSVHRFSEAQINGEPEEVAADLRDALGLAS